MSTLAVSSYSFHRLVKAGEIALTDTPRLAREVGASAIEFALGTPLSPTPDDALMRSLRAACDEAGMSITSVCISAELYRGSDADRAAAIDSVKRQMDAVAGVGVQRFRHDATLGPQNGDLSDAAFDEAMRVLVPACRTLTEHAASLGLQSSIENHGRFVQHAMRVRRLITEVDHPSFGVTLDIGNSLFAPQDHVHAARLLMPHAINLHIKDFIIAPADPEDAWLSYEGGSHLLACTLGEGNVNVAACLEIAREMGYEGPIVLEYEAPRGDVMRDLRTGWARVRKTAAHHQMIEGSQ